MLLLLAHHGTATALEMFCWLQIGLHCLNHLLPHPGFDARSQWLKQMWQGELTKRSLSRTFAILTQQLVDADREPSVFSSLLHLFAEANLTLPGPAQITLPLLLDLVPNDSGLCLYLG